MPRSIEHPETTLVYDYQSKTVELYTTSRSAWLRAIERNPQYLKAEELKPGYRLEYDLAEFRSPESALRRRPGGLEVKLQHMTQRELEIREATLERLRLRPLEGNPANQAPRKPAAQP